jgi:hypothetical protein
VALADDIEADWALFDGVEDVTVTPDTPAAAPQTGVKALQRMLTKQEAIAGASAGISPSDTIWHLWAATMGTVTTLNQGDLITPASGIVWQILFPQYSPLTRRWRCVCRKNR